MNDFSCGATHLLWKAHSEFFKSLSLCGDQLLIEGKVMSESVRRSIVRGAA